MEPDSREVVRCIRCNINQFRKDNNTCCRCKAELPETKIGKNSIKTPRKSCPSSDPVWLQDAVGYTVMELRRQKGLRQREFASKMGIQRTYVSKVENGKAMPSIISIDRFARGLGIGLVELMEKIEINRDIAFNRNKSGV